MIANPGSADLSSRGKWTDNNQRVIGSLYQSHKTKDIRLTRESKEIAIIKEALIMSASTCLGNLSMLGPALACWLLMFKPVLKNIGKLIDEVDSIGRKCCALVPPK